MGGDIDMRYVRNDAQMVANNSHVLTITFKPTDIIYGYLSMIANNEPTLIEQVYVCKITGLKHKLTKTEFIQIQTITGGHGDQIGILVEINGDHPVPWIAHPGEREVVIQAMAG